MVWVHTYTTGNEIEYIHRMYYKKFDRTEHLFCKVYILLQFINELAAGDSFNMSKQRKTGSQEKHNLWLGLGCKTEPQKLPIFSTFCSIVQLNQFLY